MPLVPIGILIRPGRGLGAFNVVSLEHAEAVVAGAEAAGLPVVLQISHNCVRFHGGRLRPVARAAAAVAEGSTARVALHLDHVEDEALLHQAADAGFGSAMFDASGLPYARNVAATRAAAGWAHAHGLWLEAELGEIGGKAGGTAVGAAGGAAGGTAGGTPGGTAGGTAGGKSGSTAGGAAGGAAGGTAGGVAGGTAGGTPGAHSPQARTDPAQALDFVTATGVDALAVAVGSTHAMTTRTAELDQDLIVRLHAAVPVPLVLHGSSGVPDGELRRAVRHGIAKVNIGTALNVAFTGAVRQRLAADPAVTDPRRYLAPARDAMAAAVARLLGVLALGDRDLTEHDIA